MTTKEIYRMNFDRRSITPEIKVFNYGFVDFGEPSELRLQSMEFQTKTIKTYRKDYHKFSFVRCKLNGLIETLVIGFEENRIERSSCQLLKNWDPRCYFLNI